MKKIALYVLLILGATFTTVSCSDDFLNVDYYSIVNPDGVYEDADNVFASLVGIYRVFYLDEYNGCWPHPCIANYPSLDMQAEGWDAELTTHSWGVEAKSGFFENLWSVCYKMIVRCNLFLYDLENTVSDDIVSPSLKKIYEGEARGLRGYCYYTLTTNFSRVPMLMTGETYASCPEKARPDSDDEAWATIIEDLEYAASVLDWKPADGMVGRFTKAAALAYAAKAHMYRGEYDKAKSQYLDIINNSGKSLDPVQAMVNWVDNPDSYEAIWEVNYPKFNKMGWDIYSYSANNDCRFSPCQNSPDEFGGWGDAPVSFEYSRCFEDGDKRLAYNVIGWHGDHGDINYYLGNDSYYYIGKTAKYQQWFQTTRSCIPNNHCIKMWKTTDVHAANNMQLYRYTGVLLDYAECCFQTGDATTGWKVIGDIRERAFGNLEVGYNPNEHTNSYLEFPTKLLNTAKVTVPDAQTVYTAWKAEKGYKSDVWKVALVQERRKEFLHEFSFWYDLTRWGSDFVKEWLDCEYPKNGGATFYNTKTAKWYIPTGENKNQPWDDASVEERANMIPVTDRDWDWNAIHVVYPIPTSELTANALCTQNEGY